MTDQTTTPSQKRVAIVGAGPSGLMAAEALARAGFAPVVFDGARAPARKFLLAGRGGLNLTHSEPMADFLPRYREAALALAPALKAFDATQLRTWAEFLGEETFVGSSGRVFPKSFKAGRLLRLWLERLNGLGVTLNLRHRLKAIKYPLALVFDTPDGEVRYSVDAAVLALGGGSWPHLGSDGAWAPILARHGVESRVFAPSNCGFQVAWTPHVRDHFVGSPLKSIAASFAGETSRGEAMITATGIEGGAIYALSAPLREAIARDGFATLHLDFKPDLSHEALAAKLVGRKGDSVAALLRKNLRLAPAAAAVLREPGPLAGDAAALAARIKHCPIRLDAPQPIARAISSAGGIVWEEIDEHFMLRKLPGVFVAGEMVDWEAQTGGYLLQACFSTAMAAGQAAARWLETRGATNA